jgi:hypothetical protein
MARFADLPADQQAVLQLIVRQQRRYDEIATLLRMPTVAVRERALTALDALAGVDPELAPSPAEQDAVADYLLGQQSASARAQTRRALERSEAARAWARSAAAQLRDAGLEGGAALPEIPAVPTEVAEAFGALHARREAHAQRARSSRLGARLLLAGLGLVVALAVVLAFALLGGDEAVDPGGTVGSTTTAPARTPPVASVRRQITLTPPAGREGHAQGTASVVVTDGRRALTVVGRGLAPSGHYALWLRSGDRARFLGFFAAVPATGSDAGRLGGMVPAPRDLSGYRELLVTREPARHPRRPTTIVLEGSLSE